MNVYVHAGILSYAPLVVNGSTQQSSKIFLIFLISPLDIMKGADASEGISDSSASFLFFVAPHSWATETLPFVCLSFLSFLVRQPKGRP
jgi:hypothetical protein